MTRYVHHRSYRTPTTREGEDVGTNILQASPLPPALYLKLGGKNEMGEEQREYPKLTRPFQPDCRRRRPLLRHQPECAFGPEMLSTLPGARLGVPSRLCAHAQGGQLRWHQFRRAMRAVAPFLPHPATQAQWSALSDYRGHARHRIPLRCLRHPARHRAGHVQGQDHAQRAGLGHIMHLDRCATPARSYGFCIVE